MAGMQGGPAVLLGKTGGYAIGYLLAALIAGAFAAKLPRKFGWAGLGLRGWLRRLLCAGHHLVYGADRP